MFWRKAAKAVQKKPATDQHPASASYGRYMTLADTHLGIFSIFDELKYDRADADMLTPSMRLHAITKLERLGFAQISGTVLQQRATGVKCYIPKFHALGASPFDITRYTPKRTEDYYILTPTQTACQFIDHYPLEEAVTRIKALIAEQPINIYKLADYLERKPAHQNFIAALGHIRYVQRIAVTSEPLKYRRALG